MKDVKEQIDKNLNLLMKQQLQLPQDALMQDDFDLRNLSYEGKCRFMLRNENKLLRLMHMQNKCILRLKGVTQSYSMYDSQLYKYSKNALQEL